MVEDERDWKRRRTKVRIRRTKRWMMIGKNKGQG